MNNNVKKIIIKFQFQQNSKCHIVIVVVVGIVVVVVVRFEHDAMRDIISNMKWYLQKKKTEQDEIKTLTPMPPFVVVARLPRLGEGHWVLFS